MIETENSEWTAERTDSIEIKTNAKGQISHAIKIYRHDIEEAFEKAKEMHKKVEAWKR